MQINWAMELTDTLVGFGDKYGLYLNAKKRRACFLFWICGLVYWIARNIQNNLYAQAISCSITLVMNIYAYINWKKGE